MASKGPNNNSLNALQVGTILWQKQSKCNAEFFALTYGALIAELLRDIEDPILITNELDRMGHSIGIRCIEEVLAKISSLSLSQQQSQQQFSISTTYKTFPETSDLIQTAFRMFLGINTESKATSDTSYTISFVDNPLSIFVELPPTLTSSVSTTTTTTATTTTDPTVRKQQSSSSLPSASVFEYSQLLVGMIRGMLEMLQYDVSCRFNNTTTTTTTMATNDIVVELKQILQDGAGDDYHEE
jgi:trafficking protein particle complex subunit 3